MIASKPRANIHACKLTLPRHNCNRNDHQYKIHEQTLVGLIVIYSDCFTETILKHKKGH